MKPSKRVVPLLFALAFGAALIGAVYWAYREFVPHFESESDLRTRLEQSGSLAQFKPWAMDRVGTKRERDVTLEQLPVSADAIHLRHVIPELNPDGTIRDINFWFGGGFHAYGVIIGEPPDKGPPMWTVHQWGEGIWYYEEQ